MDSICRLRNHPLYKPQRLFLHATIVIVLSWSLVSCQSMDPRNVDVTLPETLPTEKVTSYSQALTDLGLMTEIYNTDLLNIQSNPIGDDTGASRSTGSEIPQDITEMIKTSLNSIGGNVVFIPYDPAFVQNQTLTGYSTFENKTIPDLVLSGGITEFDRGLETRGKNTDASVDVEVNAMPDFLPSKNVGFRYGDEGKTGLARITLDFNLLDFRTLAGIAKINAVNTMEVNKAVGGNELGISLFGQSFGLKGTIKKVQGRHAAVRLLVELSMIQIVGKYLAVPYWRLLGDDALPDTIVTEAIARYYQSLSQPQVNDVIQQWLYVSGYEVPLNDKLDPQTRKALTNIDSTFGPSTTKISVDAFTKVYVNIPLSYETAQRRKELKKILASLVSPTAAETVPIVPEPTPQQVDAIFTTPLESQPENVADIVTPVPAASKLPNVPKEVQAEQTLEESQNVQLATESNPEPSGSPTQKVESRPGVAQQKSYDQKAKSSITRSGIGRFLNPEDW